MAKLGRDVSLSFVASLQVYAGTNNGGNETGISDHSYPTTPVTSGDSSRRPSTETKNACMHNALEPKSEDAALT